MVARILHVDAPLKERTRYLIEFDSSIETKAHRLIDGWWVFIRDLRYVYPQQESSPGIGMAVGYPDEDLQIVLRRVAP